MALIGVGWITDDGETDVNNIGNYFAGKQICFGMVSRTILSETITDLIETLAIAKPGKNQLAEG